VAQAQLGWRKFCLWSSDP